MTLTGLFTAGIFRPVESSLIGLFYFVMRYKIYWYFRVLYSTYYPQKGGAMNKFRRLGAVGAFLAAFANILIAGYYSIKTLRNWWYIYRLIEFDGMIFLGYECNY